MLTLGWPDGNTFIPLAFSLLSSRKDKNRINGINKNIDKRTNGYKRRREALKKSTKVMINLLKQAVKFKLPTDYVLTLYAKAKKTSLNLTFWVLLL